jgi:hypothetical protein
MPTIIGPVDPDGAFVSVLVGVSAATATSLHMALRPVPAPVSARALLDTGAEMTCVDVALIRHLQLPWIGMVPANLPAHGGVTFGSISDAGLTIVHPSGRASDNLILRNHQILELPLAHLGYEVVLGRDVLASCRLLYNGPANRFRLRY